MRSKSFLATVVILAIGVLLGAWIVLGEQSHGLEDEHGHGAEKSAEAAAEKGPHGGRMLREGDFALEMTIFERGVPPELRIYAFEKGKALPPLEAKVQVRLERLGAPPETIPLHVRQDFLQSEREIDEPHSFKVNVFAEHGGRSYRWTYDQQEGRVRMDDQTAAKAGIEVRAAGPAKIRSTLELQGEIQINRDRMAHVVPQLAGVVVQSAKNLGDQVKKGEVLAVIRSKALADMRSEHMAAQTRLELAKSTHDREKQLWEEKISAQQDYLAARNALAEAEIAHRAVEQKLLALGLTHAAAQRGGTDTLTRYEIRAPIDGVVIEKHVAAGEAVKEDATIFAIADLSNVWAEMNVYPKDLNLVRLGQNVTVRASSLNAQAEGRVSYVGSLVGEQTRSAKARVTLPNPDRTWRPGMFVTVEVVQEETEVALAVPVGAIQTYRDWKVVFGRFGDVFEARPVELGRSDGKQVEVVKGLEPGMRYAASNTFVLKADLGKAGASHDH